MKTTPESKKIHFGSTLHSDFTMHHDEERKERYIYNVMQLKRIRLSKELILLDFLVVISSGMKKH